MQPTELIVQVQVQNEIAFRRIYDMYADTIFEVIHTIIRDKSLAEEVVQDVFVKVWKNSTSYTETKGRFFTWILNIARNTAIDNLRSKSFKEQQKNQTLDNFIWFLEDHSTFSEAKYAVDTLNIKAHIDTLEPSHQRVIDLLYFKGLTQKEASETLEIPLGTVKTRNRICIRKLRERLRA